MDAITGGEIKIVSGFRIRYVTSFRMESEAQKHGYCLFEGLPDDILEVQDVLAQEKDIPISVIREGEQNEVLFRGIVRRIRLRSCNGVPQIEVLATTASILLDRDKRQRSFQDKTMTYEQAVRKITNAYGSFPVECVGEAATALKEPLIQYGETDWEFLLRLGSRLHLPVYADCTCAQPGLYFGMRQGEQRQWEAPPVQMGISRGCYAKGGSEDRMERKDYLYFTASGYQNHQPGDILSCSQCRGTIFRKRAELQGGILVFTYQAGGRGNWHIPLAKHRQLVGMEFEGTVISTHQEEMNIRLDIDGPGGGAEHDWAWTPASGNIMYAMPEKGSKVRLDFGTEEALEGTGTINVRKNSGSMPWYRERELMTAAGKKAELHPSCLSFQGGGGRTALTDGAGLSLGSSGSFVVCAYGRVRLNAAKISAATPLEINMFRSGEGSRQRGGVVMPRGTGSNPPTGGSDSGFTMSFEFNGLSQSGVLCGEDFIRYRPFKDSPEEILVETEFDWGALVGRVAFGLFWVTVVSGLAFYGASLVFTGGATAAFAPWVIGGLTAAGGAWYVEDLARKDYARGEVSPLTAYGASGLIGSTKGALAGGAFFMAPYAAPVLLSDPGIMYVENMLPASEDIVLGLTETALYATAFTNMIIQGSEMAEIGTGKNPVKAYLGEETYNKTGEWSEMGARTILIGGLCNPDFYVKNKETAHFDQILLPEKYEGGSVTLKPDELIVRDSKFLDANGNIDWDTWAPNGGRVPGTIQEGQTLEVGTIIDRYGNPYGKYTSPVGVPYEQRALPYVENPNAYHKYEVIKPIDNVTISQISEAFEQSGGGIQYELPSIVNKLIKDKFLREIN